MTKRFSIIKVIANTQEREMLEFRTSSPDSVSSYILIFFGSHSVMLTFGFQLTSVFLDSNYNVMQFLSLKAIGGSRTKVFHHAL